MNGLRFTVVMCTAVVLSQLARPLVATAADITYLPAPGRAAFIGNSLTMYNCGTDNVAKSLGDSMRSPFHLTIDRSIQTGGCPLSCHWSDTNKIAVIRNGHFDVVVMQECGDCTYSEDTSQATQFYRYAKMWADTIRATGATPMLYMMWAWREDTGAALAAKTNHQAAEYDSCARLIHAKILPMGRGYYNLRSDTSAVARSINLFVDYQHPSACATYFLGCMAFSALYNVSPVGNSYIGGAICASGRPTSAQAACLQQVAWNTWQQYGGDDSGRGYVPPTTIARHDTRLLHGTGSMATRLVRTVGLQTNATPGSWYAVDGARVATSAGLGRKPAFALYLFSPAGRISR
jgi:hypothetical protein